MTDYFRATFLDDHDDASLDPYAGGTANNKPIWTPEEIAAYLNRTGGGWGDTGNHLETRGGDPAVIAYGFHENQQSLIDNGYVYEQGGSLYAFSEYFQFGAFNAAQRAATVEAIQYWDDLVAATFVQTSSDDADINFGNLTNSPNTQAYAYLPTAAFGPGGAYADFYGEQIAGLAGDVWVSTAQASNFMLNVGFYGLTTLVHEIGHSIGLSHPGRYNFGPGFAVTYTNGAEYAQDARNYSIMSYWNPRDLGSTSTGVPTRDFNWSVMSIAYGSTPMVHDILAIQAIYGADLTTRTGDTTYGFNSNAGRDAFDFTLNQWPTMAIYDAGGNDTLDASGYAVTQVIDLTPGALSSIGGITLEQAASLTFEQVNANRAAQGMAPIALATYNANMAAFYADPEWRGRLTDNVGIAYGTIVENAIGGSGRDTIIGNSADNHLVGNAGDDSIDGRTGNDLIEGGAGRDTLAGGAGNDRIMGGDGDDFILGGDGLDLMTGGTGNDIFVAEVGATGTSTRYGSISVDIITDFTSGDLIDVSGIGDLRWAGNRNNVQEGQVTVRHFGNVNAAEHVLGVDVDGIAGVSANSGPVTVVLGNVDGGQPDFMLVLLGVQSVSASDFIF